MPSARIGALSPKAVASRSGRRQPDGAIVLPPLAFEATFAIVSGTTTITGEKSLSHRP
jgi:hypothetical protein